MKLYPSGKSICREPLAPSPVQAGRSGGLSIGRKMLIVMKLTTALLFIATFQVGAATYAQEVTLSNRNISLPQLFEVIKDQTGYAFVYDNALMQNARPVAVNYNKTPLKEVLDNCLRLQGLTYALSNGVIVVKRLPAPRNNRVLEILAPDLTALSVIEIKGRIANEKGEPLEGANVRVKGTNFTTQTAADGSFTIKAASNATLIVTFIGYDNKEVAVNDQANISVQLHINNRSLGDIVIIGYGQQHKADLTSAVATVKSEDFVTRP